MYNLSNIINETFNDNTNENVEKPLNNEFKNNLEEITISNDDLKKDLCCSICLDNFKLNDKIIKLPCKNNPHYFHKGDNENCDGIFPWFEKNNTCPVCRYEFPIERNNDDD